MLQQLQKMRVARLQAHYSAHYTPVYKEAILVTKKHRADFYFSGHFLPRLSRNDHSQVISMASFLLGTLHLGAPYFEQKTG